MPRYSKEFKDNVIKQMLPPISKSVSELHEETGVSVQSLYHFPTSYIIITSVLIFEI